MMWMTPLPLEKSWKENHGLMERACMSTAALLASTQNQMLDTLLQHVITIFELVFPRRIRAYYLTGSSMDGTAAYLSGDPLNSSDIDLTVVFRDVVQPDEQERFRQCRFACAGLSQLHPDQLDAMPLSETELFQHGHLTLKVASQLFYGEDIRDAIPLPSLNEHMRAAIRLSKDHMAEMRHLEPAQLTLPLTYPDSAGQFYGYDYSEPEYGGQPGTRMLVGSIAWGATALVALHAGQFAGTKRDAINLYKTCINDRWSQLVEAVYAKCKLRWGYTIPRSKGERQELRALCEQVIEFENHCLASYLQDLPCT